jgi:hypothetical protein
MHQETFNLVCVILEDSAGKDVEEIAATILRDLGFQGEEILDHLDPPKGIGRWLESHGLSLVATHEVAPPQEWDELEQEAHLEEARLEGGTPKGEIPSLQVGDYVEYKTAPQGPRKVSQLGSGAVVEVSDQGGLIVVQGSPHDVYLRPGDGDTINVVR